MSSNNKTPKFALGEGTREVLQEWFLVFMNHHSTSYIQNCTFFSEKPWPLTKGGKLEEKSE